MSNQLSVVVVPLPSDRLECLSARQAGFITGNLFFLDYILSWCMQLFISKCVIVPFVTPGSDQKQKGNSNDGALLFWGALK